jgi:hypothetical protein
MTAADTPPPAPTTAAAKPLGRVALVLCTLVAFRGALFFKEKMSAAAAALLGCVEAEGFPPGCTTGREVIASVVGLFVGSVWATVLFRRLSRLGPTRHRVLAAFGYLFALAAAVEVLAGTVVFSVLDRFEPAALGRAGFPRLALVPVGLLLGALWWRLAMNASQPFIVHFLGRPEAQVRPFQRFVLLKMTAGTALIALLRMYR